MRLELYKPLLRNLRFAAALVCFIGPYPPVPTALASSQSTAFMLARDPVAFVEDLRSVPQPPVALLTRTDAVAHVLIERSRTLSKRQIMKTAQSLCAEAKALGQDPLLLLSVIYVESYFNHLAISNMGAEGLMQLMPDTALATAIKTDATWRVGDSFDPVTNVTLGSRYLSELYKQYGRMDHALTAYNRGPRATDYILLHHGALPKHIHEFYSGKVLRTYERFLRQFGHLPIDV